MCVCDRESEYSLALDKQHISHLSFAYHNKFCMYIWRERGREKEWGCVCEREKE